MLELIESWTPLSCMDSPCAWDSSWVWIPLPLGTSGAGLRVGYYAFTVPLFTSWFMGIPEMVGFTTHHNPMLLAR